MQFFFTECKKKNQQSHTDLQKEIDNDGLNQEALSNYCGGNTENHFLMV